MPGAQTDVVLAFQFLAANLQAVLIRIRHAADHAGSRFTIVVVTASERARGRPRT
jgi:hypothetical protein